MPEPSVRIEKGLGPQGRIAVVRFDRGDDINALSMAAIRDLTEAARSFEDDIDTSVVVLTGTARAFSAGFDLKEPAGKARGSLPLGQRRVALRNGPRLAKAWYELDQVTIAAIEGHCIGGGVALAVALDFRFCGRSAHFRVPELELGMNMTWGSVPRMLQLMGPARTKQAVILASDRISATEALEWRLVEKVVDDGQAFASAMAFAERIGAQPPIPVQMTKQTVNRLAGALDDVASQMEMDQFALATTSDDHREGVEAFIAKRKPVFRGR
ncbi:enoyl-CoA hydratase/isomerase family protein [Reyranella sp. CPCC 100927]|uniref:enoyl-CoA hydratase/isomerase family protein n=1 Tax=Reyranella sp. CPCC 100927 TaxID=2599616 RepID=UPI0011B4CD50|nr:enoyl-CoA hydratase/isomerase family protein [Reyranella sp. CPCC 100927]TWS97339.1 enoyl-CoA hydratase/isomerase family protein [Reyranella sp. CPCC 100927]